MSARARSSLLVVVLAAGCATLEPSVRPRTADTAGRRGGLGVPSLDPGRGTAAEPGRGDLPTSTEHPAASAERRVCRTGSWPSGWIAVAYEAASGTECPQSGARADGHPVAVLVRYAGQAPNAT